MTGLINYIQQFFKTLKKYDKMHFNFKNEEMMKMKLNTLNKQLCSHELIIKMDSGYYVSTKNN